MKTAIEISDAPPIPGARILLLQSKWYLSIVHGMSLVCCESLSSLGCAKVEKHTLPGSLEMPFATNYLLNSGRVFDAVICLGVILKGETLHFEMVTRESFAGLSRLSLHHGIPIINVILPVTDIAHAEERSRNDPFNKGLEAAVAAAEIVAWRSNVDKNK